MSPAVAGGRGRVPAFFPKFLLNQINIYGSPSATPETPDTVVVLGQGVWRTTHYLFDRGHSRECQGEGCDYCHTTKSKPTENYYVPALVHRHGHKLPEGSLIWQRCAYSIPVGSWKWYWQKIERGSVMLAHRFAVKGGVVKNLVGESVGLAYYLADEEHFPIEPILDHAFYTSADTGLAVKRITDSLPPTVIAPVLRKIVTASPYADTRTPEEREEAAKAARKMRESIKISPEPEPPVNEDLRKQLDEAKKREAELLAELEKVRRERLQEAQAHDITRKIVQDAVLEKPEAETPELDELRGEDLKLATQGAAKILCGELKDSLPATNPASNAARKAREESRKNERGAA